MSSNCYENNRYKAEIVRWVDGDTIELIVDLGQSVCIRGNYRLARIDAPETKLYKGVTAEEKTRGLDLLIYLDKMFADEETIEISTYKKGKYGRYIIEIWMNDDEGKEYNLSNFLIAEGLVEYKEY